MGLDQNFHRVHKDAITTNVDFKVDGEKFVVTEVAYFRKNSALQGWMHDLYRRKAGTDPTFNCCNLLVTIEDLLALRNQLKANKVLPTSGFFFGDMCDEKYEQLKQVVVDMIDDYDENYCYFYSAWY